MIEQLPAAYIERMREWLGGEADAFMHSYTEPRTHGLRLNGLKLANRPETAAALIERFGLTPVPWCRTGYYYDETQRPGRSPYHAAGLYYIQEPSAMSAVSLLAPEPGDTVLDLAAAPGGKSTQIAADLNGEGLLIANEIHPARAKILSENIERLGIANAIVTNMAPGPLAERFPAFFDKIMLDAPCSGEGMFRKDPDAILEWSPDHVTMCAARQWDILADALRMLKPGGVLAYSTCTFAPEENERNVERLLREYPELELLRQERIWPHQSRGEGHFVALLRKRGAERSGADQPHGDEVEPITERTGGGKRRTRDSMKRKGRPDSSRKADSSGKAAADALRAFERASREWTTAFAIPDGEPILFGEQLYLLPRDREQRLSSDSLHGLKVVRPGLHVAEIKKDRLEPAHALALYLPWDAEDGVQLDADSAEASAWLHGETLPYAGTQNGWTVVHVNGFPLGWGKASGGQVKNHYPKGLRWNK